MRFLSMSTGGVHLEPEEEVHQTVLDLYFGEDRSPAEDIDLEEMDDLLRQLAKGQRNSIRHPGAHVPPVACPFRATGALNAFLDTCEAFEEQRYVPPGYQLRADELEPQGYPVTQQLRAGRGRSKKRIVQELPVEKWYPMAVTWVRAFVAMEETLAHISDGTGIQGM